MILFDLFNLLHDIKKQYKFKRQILLIKKKREDTNYLYTIQVQVEKKEMSNNNKSNNSNNNNNNNNKSNYNDWFREIKQDLLISEPQNIAARAQCCQNIINESITHLNMQLGLKQLQSCNHYKCNIDARVHLKFLIDWPGLRIGSDSAKAPRSKREYEKKAKNWLNGRRAPNYGKTLFPHFISEAEQYSNKVTKFLINDDKKKQSLYYKILIYKVLAQLCGCSVSLNEQAKKAPFFCKNSIERKGKLKEILQAYAFDHQYIQGFPSCFEEAIDYFENKSNLYFAQFRTNYMTNNEQNNNNNNNNNDDNNNKGNNNNNTSIPDDGHNINNTSIQQIPPKMPKIEPGTPSPQQSPQHDHNTTIHVMGSGKQSMSSSKQSVSNLNHNSNKRKRNDIDDVDTKHINNQDNDDKRKIFTNSHIKSNKLRLNLKTDNQIHGQQIISPRHHMINPPIFNGSAITAQPPKKRQRIDQNNNNKQQTKQQQILSMKSNNNNGNGGNNNNNNNKNHNLNNSMFGEIHFWKSRSQQFEQQYELEKKRRIGAEKERDQYISLLKIMQSNLNTNLNTIKIDTNNNNNIATIFAAPPSTNNASFISSKVNGNNIHSNNSNNNALSALFLRNQINQNTNNNNNTTSNQQTMAPFKFGLIATPPRNASNNNNINNNNNNQQTRGQIINANKANAFSTSPPNITAMSTIANITNLPLQIQNIRNGNNVNMLQNMNQNINLVNLQSLQSLQQTLQNNSANNKIGEQMASQLLRILSNNNDTKNIM